MGNYIKSELYRIFHSVSLYITIFAFAGLPLLLNIILYGFGRMDAGFRYATTSFSYSNVVANPMIFCFSGLVVVFVLYEKSKKNGNLKNIIAFGISRTKIFAAQFIVSFLVSVVILIITEAVYIGSAVLLLTHQGPVLVCDMFMAVVASSFIVIASLIFSILTIQLFDRISTGISVWICVFCLIPQAFSFCGLVVEPVQKLAMWFPYNFFNTMTVNTKECIPVWNTGMGLMKCFLSGIAGILLFSIAGVLFLRKKEV